MKPHPIMKERTPLTTGMQYEYQITTVDGDGDIDTQTVQIIALDTSHSWERLGQCISTYMHKHAKVLQAQLLTVYPPMRPK